MLNGLWLSFFVVATVSALAQWLVGGNAGIFSAIVESIFAMAKLSVEVMILLFGTLTLWLGFLRIAEKAGIVDWLGKALGPLFKRLMPEVPPGHPALGFITLNFAANGLGLDNAATPIGLKAMRALQELNPSPLGIEQMRRIMSLQLFDTALLDDNLLAERVAVAVHQPRNLFSTMMVPNMTERLEELQAPILGFWGTDDNFNPASGALKVLTHAPNARFIMFNQCGHWVQVEHRDMFNKACLEFLRG